MTLGISSALRILSGLEDLECGFERQRLVVVRSILSCLVLSCLGLSGFGVVWFFVLYSTCLGLSGLVWLGMTWYDLV